MIDEPITEYEWDEWVLTHGTQFHQCVWLAINQPAPKPRPQRRHQRKGETP